MPSSANHQPAYRVFRMDLTNIRSAPGEQIVALGEPFESVIPFAIPAGTGCTIRFGDGGDDISLDQTPPLKICPPGGTGIRFRNTVAAPGSVAVFLVGFVGGVEADV